MPEETVEQTVARVLNELYGTCMLADQVKPVLDALEKEGLCLINTKSREDLARTAYEAWRAHSEIGEHMKPWGVEDQEITDKWYHEADAILNLLSK